MLNFRRSNSSGKRVRILLWLLALLPWLSTRAEAQLPRRISERSVISLLTFSPGKPVHALFGHGAFRVVDPVIGLDALFNYGTFDFDDEFVPKFMYGELDYYLSVVGTADSLEQAAEMQRSVIEQVLDLNSKQRQALYGALVSNAQPENCIYRYDFLFDNCSTRVIDILSDTLAAAGGEQLVMPTGPYEARSFRVLLAEHVAAKTWLEFGFDLLLGATVDRNATIEESWFLPVHLMHALDDATLAGRPIVSETKLLTAQEPGELPSRAFDQAAALCWLLLAIVLVSLRKDERGRTSRIFDASLFGVTGLVGIFLALMWLGTLHHVTAVNWNLLWAWPTHLAAAFFLAKKPRPAWLRVYLGVAGLAALSTLLSFAMPQEFAPAILPLSLILVVRCARNLRAELAGAGE